MVQNQLLKQRTFQTFVLRGIGPSQIHLIKFDIFIIARVVDRPGRGRENNIKMDLKEMVCEDMGRIHLAQDMSQWLTLMNAVISVWVS
jgi:hypothetical protein